MPSINLLPSDLIPKKSVLKLSSTVKKISIIGYSALLITTLVLVGVFFVLSRQIDTTIENQNNLKSQISSMEQTEQRLVLIKDRLEKASDILGRASAKDEIEGFEKLVDILPENTFIGSVALEVSGTNITIRIPTSSTLVELFSKLISSGIYSEVVLKSFSFAEGKGYSLIFTLNS